MDEYKIIVTRAYPASWGNNEDGGAESKIQPLLDDGWVIVDMKMSGRTPFDTTIVFYLKKEKRKSYL